MENYSNTYGMEYLMIHVHKNVYKCTVHTSKLRPNPEKNIVNVILCLSYNFTLCLMLLQHIYHGQPYARIDFIPQSGT